MKPPAIAILGENSLPIARKIQQILPEAVIYGLVNRTQSADVTYTSFGETIRELFTSNTPIIGICAAGILIRTLAPLISDKRQEPPVLAIAEDGSAVVPLLGGLHGVNDLARQIAAGLQVLPAITTTGDIRFRTALLSPPAGYYLANPEDAKTFISDLLAGAKVRLEGSAPWLTESQLPISADGELTIRVTQDVVESAPNCLVYHPQGKLAIVGTGPGSPEWMSPEVKELLLSATDWVGYTTYLNLVEPLRQSQQRHDSDNRVELDRARLALNLAAEGRSVALISSGDPGIFAMAAAVFEVLEQENQPQWQQIKIQVAPGISALQAAASRIGAPIGHDFCAISLSDILKPWDIIEKRIASVAEADFVIAFYNPVSKQRTWQLERTREILLQWRSPDTPVILAKNVGRVGESVEVRSLHQLSADEVDMQTLVLVGSSQTRIIKHPQQIWVYTPRRYDAANG
ncbi:precorrin-3B C(17)-methyltransferase [Merismopedia glauca]|uniref:Precorrin-3B C(17)-methyltransferase n=1 Tax=Merismopedia glauca CCAP 1448/3 TaxID=1296344 RepID=A0A2T1C6I7_9CYAN|nr:precorrin-3B C(17)-methyltransferase [Merismopedia glauca]PSB03753.1 precorrin-3B C(17)-methyltransferase [Merismopedia glauca CCAP 1448/3]